MSREIQDLLQRLRKLEDNRRQWEDHWQELGELFLPRRADFTTTHQPGQRRQERQFDGVPMQAARGLASSIDGLLKPKSERWFTLTTANDEFDDLDDVKLWFEFVQDRMWQAIYDPTARFVQRSNEVDLDLTVFGTGVLFVGERMRLGGPVLDFRSYHLRNTFIAENADGEIDTVFRRLTLTARQAAQKFPEERLGRRTRELLRSNRDREKEVRFVHAVLPRKERGGKGPPNRNMPFASLWIDVDSEHLIAEGGFNEMPYIVPRFDTGTDEIYGRSPAMVALPDANTLMEQGKTILKAGHKIVDPPLLSPNEGVASRPRTFPGGITYYDAEILSRTGGRQPIFPLLTGANIPIGRDMQSDSREQVWSGPFPSASHEDALDFARMVDQQQQEQLDRAFKVPASDPVTSVELAKVDIRKGKLLGFDSVNGSFAYFSSEINSSLDLATATGSTTPRTFADRFAETINVKDHGAKGDGITDDTEAFKLLRDQVEAHVRTNPAPAANANKLSDVTVVIPAGDYLITEAEAVIRSSFSTRTVGLRFVGIGGRVQMMFQPSTSGAMFDFNDSFLAVDFENIEFNCNDSGSNFVNATSSGGTQSLRFKRCHWSGQWQYCFRLKGSNNNSEYRWVDCGIGATSALNAFLWLEENDQFLNYWFERFVFAPSVGTWIRATKGGHAKIVNCDISGWAPTSETYLFELLGFTHSRGVTGFSCVNTRFELKSDNAKVIKSEWPHGNILFKACDFGSQANTQTNTVENFFFNVQNTQHATVSFEDCTLIGKINVEYSINAFDHRALFRFVNCDHIQHVDIDDFVTYTKSAAHSNDGGQPVLHFENCRGSGTDDELTLWDSDFGWHRNISPVMKQRWTRISTARGFNPRQNGSGKVILPPNAIITRIRTHVLAGTFTSEAFDWDIQTNEGTPTVLRNVAGADASLGIDDDHNLFFRCGTTLTTRTVVVQDNHNFSQASFDMVFLIEYIG